MNKTTFKLVPRNQTIFGSLKEMIGRALANSGVFGNSLVWQLYSTVPSVDFAKVNYTLTRAIFYASEITDPITGQKYGKEYLLGAGFGKPIVNATAAFTIGKLPEVVSDNEANDDQISEVNSWFEENKSSLFATVRNSFRDGDAYLRLNKDLSCELIAPWKVDKVTDPVSGVLLGYDITSYVSDVKSKGSNDFIKYVEKLRTTKPFRGVYKYAKDSKTGTLVLDSEDNEGSEKTRPLPLIHFPNEKEADQAYGNSEYQSLYIFMANYHAVLENAIKNNIYNSNAVPIFKGIKNMKEFLETNGEKQTDGTYQVKWDPNKLLIGGEGFDASILSSVANANDADKILNLLFWLIAQNSETPEFIFGTAVQSSKASVSEQMPVMVKKAERKQGQLNDPLWELVDVLNFYASKLNTKFEPSIDFEIKWFPILDEDLKLNLDIVKELGAQGVITDSTKLLLLNMGRYVEDFDKEIADAQAELGTKQQAADQNALANQPTVESAIQTQNLTPAEIKLAMQPAQ